MSGGAEVDTRRCPTCGGVRTSDTQREGDETQVYYECPACQPATALQANKSPRRATGISTFSSAPSHAPPPGTPVAGP